MWKNQKIGDLFDFERGHHWCAFSWTICDKNCHIIRCIESNGFSIMTAYTIMVRRTSAKRNSVQKSTLTERDCCILRRIVSKNHRTTATQVTAELNIYLENPISTKTVQCELHKSSVHGRTVIAEPLVHKRWCPLMTIKPRHQTTGNARDMVRWVFLHSVCYVRRVYVWRTPKQVYNLECLVPTV
jgi:hypothetical protein